MNSLEKGGEASARNESWVRKAEAFCALCLFLSLSISFSLSRARGINQIPAPAKLSDPARLRPSNRLSTRWMPLRAPAPT